MLSKYQRISQDLIDKIDKQEIKVHSYLPSENELMKLYNASRDTIRKALDILLKNGYIQKNKGKGSLVLDVISLTRGDKSKVRLSTYISPW